MTIAAGRAPASSARRRTKYVISAGARAAARFTLFRPDSRSITDGTSPCLTRLSPRQSTSQPGASRRAARSANCQLRLTGSDRSSHRRETVPSIAMTSPIIPRSPHGTPAGPAARPNAGRLHRRRAGDPVGSAFAPAPSWRFVARRCATFLRPPARWDDGMAGSTTSADTGLGRRCPERRGCRCRRSGRLAVVDADLHLAAAARARGPSPPVDDRRSVPG